MSVNPARAQIYASGLRIGLAAVLSFSILWTTGQQATANRESAGARILIEGTITGIDRKHRTIMVRHAALETAPEGTRVCLLPDRRELARLRVGDHIEAIANTAHTPWVLKLIEFGKQRKLRPRDTLPGRSPPAKTAVSSA